MEEAKKKVTDICELKQTLITAARDHMNQGLQGVNTHELGEVVDMIKDLCEAEEKIYKSCYYKTVVEAMKEEKKQEEMMTKMGMLSGSDRMGYDNWRYSSGRFAPTGHGHRSGYHDPEQIEKWMHEEAFPDDPWVKAGYSGSRGGSSNNGRSSNTGSMDSNGRMGYTGSPRGHHYDRYSKARMGYHESKDASHKESMDAASREYVVDMAEALKEVWTDADPAMRKEIKNKFISLMNEMN